MGTQRCDPWGRGQRTLAGVAIILTILLGHAAVIAMVVWEIAERGRTAE